MIEKCLGTNRVRRIQRLWRQGKVTLLCFFLTVIVLRGTIGAGKFGTPEQDIKEIREHFFYTRKLVEISTKTTSEDGETKPYSLGPKISNWDEQRLQWLKQNPNFSNFVAPNKPRVLLVTGSAPKPCENPVGDLCVLKSIKNKIDYCRIHEIEIFHNTALLDAEMSGFGAKLQLIRKLLLSHPEIEFIWWMDSDAMFTDMVFELPWERYKDYNVIMHGWNERVYDQKNWIGVNTGSFLIRNSQWSLDLLDVWSLMGPKGKIREESGKILNRELNNRPVIEADDQSAMVYILAKEREKWGDKVYLENGYYSHGFIQKSLGSRRVTPTRNQKDEFGLLHPPYKATVKLTTTT